MTIREILHHLFKRKEPPLTLAYPLCAGCHEAITENDNGATFQGRDYHGDCLIEVPTVLRRGGAV